MYNIYKSNRKNKKYIAVFTDSKKVVHFGDSRYGQYKDKTKLKLYSRLDHNDPKRKDSYYARHGVKAELYTPLWFSHKYLWWKNKTCSLKLTMIIELIVTVGGVFVMLISTIAWNIRRSRCTHLECFCGKCDRTLMTMEEVRMDTLQKNMFSI